MGSQAFDDLCQAFVEQASYGHQGVYPTALAAWNAQQNKAVKGGNISNAQPGDLLYFQDPNQSAGHTGIYMGNNKMTSATYNGVKTSDLGDWLKSTGQKLLGYIPQGQGAQGLGANLNQQNNSLFSNAQKVLDDQNAGRSIWDDNARAQANRTLAMQNPQVPKTPQQQLPQYDFNNEMQNFSSAWNATHSSPIAGYM